MKVFFSFCICLSLCGIRVYMHVTLCMGTWSVHVCGILKLRSGVFFKCSPHCNRGLTEPRACQLQLLYLFRLLQEFLCLLLYPGITGGPLHPPDIYMCAGGVGRLNPRPHICESSTLITELSFQPPLPSFNLVCQIIQKA